MYTFTELKELTMTPRINDISLELLRKVYSIYLNPFIYHYIIKDTPNT